MTNKIKFQDLVDNKKWEGVIKYYHDLSESEKENSQFCFYNATAYFEIGNFEQAHQYVLKGLGYEPHSSWGRKLLYKYEEQRLGESIALSNMYEYIIEFDINSPSVLDFFVQRATDMGLFSKAAIINERREVVANKIDSFGYAVAIQCFNKPDTLDEMLNSLTECTDCNRFSVVLLQDAWEGSKKEDIYKDSAYKVQEIIAKWLPLLSIKFINVTVIRNERNLGTAPSCRRLLDYVSNTYKGFVFFEDDCVLSRCALSWSLYCLEERISSYDCWFATCESIFFDSRGYVIPDDTKAKLKSLSLHASLLFTHCEFGFVPSTCFMTRSKIWEQFSKIRSFPKGPESLNKFYKSKLGRTLFPIVPRVKDIGMLHELGYSVATLGKDNVKEVKSTYLLAEGRWEREKVGPYVGDMDLLFSATAKVNQAHLEKVLLQLQC